MSKLVWVRINKTLEAADRAAQPRILNISTPASVKLPPAVPTSTQPSTTVSVTPRPSIKLKVGGTSTDGPSGSLKLAPKPKGKKVQERISSPVPPSPSVSFIDDGSADLLEEVIAIEREKDQEQRKRKTSVVSADREKEKDKHVPKLVIGKRKKVTDEPTEDEILALAAPPKREKPTVSPPVAGPSSAPVNPPQNGASVAAVTHRNGTAPQKNKDRGTKRNPVVTAEPSAEPARRGSTKGKEKEVPPREVPASAKAKKSPPQTTPINEKKCREVLKTLTKLPDARIFLQPVDPILDGCPT